MDSNREAVYLAALLHDIGKFYQRADKNLLRDYGDGHLDRMKSLICPEKNGRFGYHHAWWTYKFFYDNQNLFNSIKDKGDEVFRVIVNEQTQQDNLINLSVYHHNPYENSELQKLIQLADWWSSGMERTLTNMEKEDGETYGKFKYKKVKLKNLLSLIKDGVGNSEFPMKPLDITDNCFPIKEKTNDYKGLSNEEASRPYHDLLQGFSDQLKSLPTDSVKGFLNSLIELLRKFTWCIPASTNDLAHISLYEHLKTTAAIALALYDYKQATSVSISDIRADSDKFPLLLSCWDISGIQKFIYNISGTKASVSLKGRSFYLQLLMETIKQMVLDHSDIKGFSGQIVYSSGGKMFVILPNTENCKNVLRKVHEKLEEIIWNEHKEALYVSHGFIEFRCISARQGGVRIKTENKVPLDGTISDLWDQVIRVTSANKYNKYKNLLNRKVSLKPFGQWGRDYELCAVTGIEGRIGKELVKLGEDLIVSKIVRQQIDLGQALKDADYIITYLDQDVKGNSYLMTRMNEKKSMHLTIGESGIHHYLFDQEELTNNEAEFRKITSVDVSKVRRINNTDFHQITALKGKRSVYGYEFYGGNTQAYNEKERRNKTFEELCYNGSYKSTYLGVLRMDVDGLGKIFRDGLSEKLRSLAAYSTLSAQLDWFFSGYLNTIRNSKEFNEYVNIIYSGGDDVFAVGRWDKIILFAEQVRNDFRRYCGGREDVSISAGIAIAGEKYPIRMAANEAGQAEDQSKKFKKTGSENATKNAITFFGQTVEWEKEFVEVKKIKDNLVMHCTNSQKPLSKAILHQLMQWKALKDEFEKGDGSLSFKWHTAYYLKRYMDRYKEESDQEIREYLRKIQTSLMSGQLIHSKEAYGLRSYDLLGLAARWAEMELKEYF